ncbi:MAG: MCE family protein [Cyanobacteria bacterium SZAS LIN-3]|nr:MCE family protein [Cyanobacteria bacterium SZAS LIN-3]
MRNKPNYELRVGLVSLGAVCLLFNGWGWLKGFSLLHPPQRFIAQFHDVAGLNNNAPVNINGVRVGVVENIELRKTAPAEPAGTPRDAKKSKEQGIVFVHLKISTEATTIPVGSLITIQTQGLVGAKYIEITLPEVKPGDPMPADIQPDTIVAGQDPVRIELVMNKIASKLNSIVNSAGSDDVGPSLAEALRHSGEAVNNINEAAKKLNRNMDRFGTASDTFTATATKIGKVADSARSVTGSASAFFNKGNKALDQVNILAVDFQGTSKRMNKILDNPTLSSDLKETARLAKATSESIAATVDKLNGTVKDPAVRGDIITILNKIDGSLTKANVSLSTVNKITDDKEFRAVIGKFSDSLTKFDDILGSSGLTTDTKSTFAKLRTAADDVDIAARQIQNVLDKPRGPLKWMIGKQGERKDAIKDTKGSLVEKVNTDAQK